MKLNSNKLPSMWKKENTSSIILLLLGGFLLLSCERGPRKPVLNDQQMKELREPLVRANTNMAEQDYIRIKKYAERKGWQMTETETGLFYQILQNGTGDSIKSGQLVEYRYIISQLGGDTLYTDQKDGIRSLYVDQSNAEEGVNQAVKLMTRGTKARLILAPHLAYGLRGDDAAVSARAILIYDIELLNHP